MDSLIMQVRCHPTAKHCDTIQGKMQMSLFSAAVDNRLTSVLFRCNYTCVVAHFAVHAGMQ